MSTHAERGNESIGLTPTGRVPAEHRWLGLDRRTLLPGFVVIGLMILWTIILPLINDQISYDQETKAGDVFQLSRGLTMDAQPGWGVNSGLLTTDSTLSGAGGANVSLSKGGTYFTLTTGPFSGDVNTLLSGITKVETARSGEEAFHVNSDVETFHTNQGHPGVLQSYATIGGQGTVSALVYEDTGLEIVYTGPDSAFAEQAASVGKMIDSIEFDPEAAK